MKFLPGSREVTLLLLLVAGVALPQATSWKGMLQAQPAQRTLSTTTQRIGLTGFRECAILVGIMPEALKDSVTAEDIEGWAANRLQEIGLSVVSKED